MNLIKEDFENDSYNDDSMYDSEYDKAYYDNYDCFAQDGYKYVPPGTLEQEMIK